MITIDSRECSAVVKAFKKHKIEHKVEALPVGDFMCEKNLVIEHKSVSDFVSSFRSGHLQKQLLQQEQFKHSFLIITGNWSDLARFGKMRFTVNQLTGMLASVAVRYSVKMVHVVNNSQMALTVQAICKKCDDGKEVTIRDTELLRNTMTKEDIKIKILTCFDGVGIKTAEKILKDLNCNNMTECYINFINRKRK